MKRGLQGRFVKQTTAGDHTKKDGIRKLRPRFTFILNQYEYMGQDGG
ncbi:MAG: hypothetical protein FJY85_15855, partial [Deltaproteobacteria bacterium]|nr:hypothetical protein [Deltaproteobacteria bacterium]